MKNEAGLRHMKRAFGSLRCEECASLHVCGANASYEQRECFTPTVFHHSMLFI
ncbi:MAG: hypothetical protein IJY04_07690 [Clostridia bacterium]|nr:hypothetical protein [Clostridia bacterium]